MSSDRLRNYKNMGKDTTEMRRRRVESNLELRKNKKDEQLSKRRNVGTDEVDSMVSPVKDDGVEQQNVSLNDDLQRKILEDLFSDEPDRQFRGAQTARKVLSRERNPPIETVIKAGIVPRCVEFLYRKDFPDLQFEAAWVLTNIASGTSEQTNVVVQAGAIPPFILMLHSPHSHIAEQATWALGNIAGDGPFQRDNVIKAGVVAPLVALAAKNNVTATFLRNVAWTLSNLCRTKNPPPPIEATRQCLPALAHLINLDDTEVIADACWALSYLSDGSNDKIEEVVKAGVVTRLVKLLRHNAIPIITPCLRAVGNIVTGNDSQTHAVLKAGVLPALIDLFKNFQSKPNIIKEAAWTVSNIAAGSLEQVNMVIQSGIVPHMIEVLRKGDLRAQKEAVWAITNITSGGSLEHLIYLGNHGMIQAFCDLLTIRDWKTVVVILDGIENMLRAAQDIKQLDKVAMVVEECGGLDKIEQLQNHENTTVYEKAYNIVDLYFSDGENAEDAEIVPDISQDGTYKLNVNGGAPANGYDF